MLDIANSEEAFQLAKPYFDRALQFDPDNQVAHGYLAQNHLWYHWDFEAAEKEYRSIKELNYNYSWPDLLIASGKFAEAVKDAELGINTDPLNSFSWGFRILSLYFNDQPDEALDVIDQALELNLGSNLSHPMEASRVYLYLGLYDKVVETIQKYLSVAIVPRPRGILAIAYYHLGEDDKVKELLDELKTQSEESSAGSPAFYTAMIYAQMGEIDTAFQWLEKAYQDREVEMYWLNVEPPFEPLRNDPRWQVMLDKVGFPE
jgi:tetratricopeptide (TPR) repeat protein